MLEPRRRVSLREREIAQGQLGVGVGICERGEQLRTAHHRRRPDEADLDQSLGGSCQRLGCPLGLVLAGDRRTRLGQERLAGVGQADAAGVTFEELDAELRLELGDRVRESRLGDVQARRSARDLPLLGDREEIAQLASLEAHIPPCSRRARYETGGHPGSAISGVYINMHKRSWTYAPAWWKLSASSLAASRGRKTGVLLAVDPHPVRMGGCRVTGGCGMQKPVMGIPSCASPRVGAGFLELRGGQRGGLPLL